MENNVVDVELKDNLTDEEQAASVEISMQALKVEFEKLEALKEKAMEAIRYLKKQ